MESLRHQLLQAELTRIEEEATAKSIAIMNKADMLVIAHQLCAKINEGITCGVRFDPIVSFYSNTTFGINIYTGRDGDVFIARLCELGLAWQDIEHGFDDQRRIEVDGARGITVFIREKYLAEAALKAAA